MLIASQHFQSRHYILKWRRYHCSCFLIRLRCTTFTLLPYLMTVCLYPTLSPKNALSNRKSHRISTRQATQVHISYLATIERTTFRRGRGCKFVFDAMGIYGPQKTMPVLVLSKRWGPYYVSVSSLLEINYGLWTMK